MNFQEYKTEIIIGGSLGFLFVFLFANLLSWSPKKSGLFQNISFEMVRPKSEYRNEFTLEGREIDKKFINPFVKKVGLNSEKKEAPKLAQVDQKNINAKKESSKKTETKDKKFDVNIVPKDPSRKIVGSDEDYYNNYYNNLQKTNRDPKAKNKVKDKEIEKQTNKTTSDFADLSTSPTPERVKALIQAYKNGELAASDYYEVVNTMLSSSNPQSQSLGVYACYSTPDMQTFSMVTLSLDKFTPEVKTYADQFLNSFNSQAQLKYLGEALKSSEIKVVLKAGEVIILGLQKVKNGQTISYTGRDSRGNNDINSVQYFNFLAPIAESLKGSQEQSVASMGQSILQEISFNSP